MGSLIAECAQHLRASPHDYEKLLGSSIESVWRTVSSAVERQLRLQKSVGVLPLGKFAFIKDMSPPMPLFLLADRFVSSYSVVWRRPPPALVTPVTDLNLSTIGSEAGGLPRDQVAKTLDAIVAFIGGRLQKGTATGSLRVGAVGYFTFDGKALTFTYDPSFLKSMSRTATLKTVVKTSSLTVATDTYAIPRAASLQTLPIAPVDKLHLPLQSQPDPLVVAPVDSEKTKHRHHHHHSKKHDRHTKSSTDLANGVANALLRQEDSATKAGQAKLQILPRFMLPDPRHAAAQQVYERQAASLQHAFLYKRRELERCQQQSDREDKEIIKRVEATRLRFVQEQAQRVVNQRDLDAFLSSQLQAKYTQDQAASALNRKAVEYDAIKILPRDPVVTEEQRHQAKLHLRQRLHAQVALKDTLTRQTKAIDRAESAYFMGKVKAQAELEEQERIEHQRIAREALTKGWEQQRVMQRECDAGIRR